MIVGEAEAPEWSGGNAPATGKSYGIAETGVKRPRHERVPARNDPSGRTGQRHDESGGGDCCGGHWACRLPAERRSRYSGVPASEARLAAKLVDLGVPIPLEGEAMQQAALRAVQGMMFGDGVSQEQARQVLLGINKHLEASKPEIKEAMIKSPHRRVR